jgi:hypothetical protein
MIRREGSAYPLLPAAEILALSAWTSLSSLNPLFRPLAYEFCTVTGAIASLVFCAGTAIRLAAIAKERPLLPSDRAAALAAPLAPLLIVLALRLATGAATTTCRFDTGMAWFFLQTGVSALFGASCGIWAARGILSTPRLLFRAFLPTLLFSLLTLRDLWVDPPLFFLHPAFGYFAGPLYDEWIPITAPVVTFRVWTLLLSVWLVLSPLRGRLHAAFGAALLGVLFFRAPLGWFHSAEGIRAALGRTLKTENVRLYYREGSPPEAKALRLIRTLDFRVRQAAQRMDIALPEGHPVEVYLYPDADLKRELTGTRYTEIGNPLQRRLQLLSYDTAGTTLTHELTHVVAAPLGLPWIGLPTRAGLLEGLATAMEAYRGDYSVHEWAAGMKRLGRLPDLNRAIGTVGFLGEAPARAYLAAGSFCGWLVENFGTRPFARVYGGASFWDAYRSDLPSLIARWKGFLDLVPLTQEQAREMEGNLSQRPIFERRCPHDLADQRHRASVCLMKGDKAGAVRLLEQAWGWGRQPFYLGLRLSRLQLQEGTLDAAESSIERTLASETGTPEDSAQAALLMGDLSFLRNLPAEAEKRWSAARDGASPDLRLPAEVRLLLLSSKRTELIKPLILRGPDRSWLDLFTRDLPATDDRRLFLFAAQSASGLDEPALARRMLTLAGEQTDERLETERLLLDAGVAEDQGDIALAVRDWQTLFLKAKTAGQRLRAVDQITRLKAVN